MSGWTEADLAAHYRQNMPVPKANKYNARKKEVDGIVFDSCREAERYIELKALEVCGEITDLRLQPEFVLQAAQAGMRAIKYRADFEYRKGRGGRLIVEDVKGLRTPVYRLKAKLFRARYTGVDFREI